MLVRSEPREITVFFDGRKLRFKALVTKSFGEESCIERYSCRVDGSVIEGPLDYVSEVLRGLVRVRRDAPLRDKEYLEGIRQMGLAEGNKVRVYAESIPAEQVLNGDGALDRMNEILRQHFGKEE